MKYLFAVSIGVFVGNWFFTPYMVDGATHIDGFVRGVVAALIVLLLGSIIRKLGWAFQS